MPYSSYTGIMTFQKKPGGHLWYVSMDSGTVPAGRAASAGGYGYLGVVVVMVVLSGGGNGTGNGRVLPREEPGKN